MLINLFNRFATSPLIRFRKARRRSAQRCQARAAMTERLEERRLLTFGFADSGQLLTGVDPQGGNTADVVLADFDGDSDLDAAVANRNFDSPNQVYINRGDGYFTTSVALPAVPVWGLTEDLEAGDLDGDGDVDLVTSSFRQDWPQVLLNNGNANFTLAATLSGQRLVARGSALGDLNGDGDLDILFATSRQIYSNNGSGSFTATGTVGAAVGEDFDVDLVDIDGDRDLDAIFSSQRISGNDVFVNDGLGNFTFSQTLARSGLGATRYQIGLADVDGDGDVDVLNNMSDGRYIDLWTNNGSGSFSLQSTIRTQGRNWRIVTGDVDLDGDIDFYAAGENRQGMFLNNGSGSFTEFVNPTQINFDHSAALGDLDGDGDLDIFQGRGSSMDSGSESPDKVWFNGLDPVTNTVPELTANAAAVSANEGGTVANSGTFSDAQGNSTVTITASVGTVTQNNTTGTWSWSLNVADGPASGNVTITARDNQNAAANATFGYSVNNVAPTISLNGNATVNEGSPYTLNLGAVTDPGTDTITSYRINWGDGTNSGLIIGNPANTSATHTFADGPSTQTNNVTVTDEDGNFLAGTLSVQVLNVAPTANFLNNGPVTYGQTATVSFDNQNDASAADATAGFHYAYSLTGDFTGITYASGSSTSATQNYAGLNAGEYAVYARIIDRDGGFNDYVQMVTVNKADAIVTVNGYTGIYDAAAHGATGSVVGVIDDVFASGTSLDLGSSFTNAPGGTANWSFNGGTNYNDQSGTVEIVIAKAASSVTATGDSFTYDGTTHTGGSGSVSGVGGVTGGVTLSYSGDQINAGSYTVIATYVGDENHTGSSDSATITIAKATSSVTVTGGTFTYDGTTHNGGSAVVSGAGVVTGSAVLSYSGDQINAGSYTVTATYAGDENHTGSSASATMTITPKLLEASAWSQGTINIGSNGKIVLHLAVNAGQLYGSDTVYSLFNGATFTIKIQKADGSVTYGTLTSTAKVETDGSITISLLMNNDLRADLYDAYINGRAVNFNMTATANGGNYAIDENTMSRLLNNGAFKYVL